MGFKHAPLFHKFNDLSFKKLFIQFIEKTRQNIVLYHIALQNTSINVIRTMKIVHISKKRLTSLLGAV